MKDISVQELALALKKNQSIVLIDVREDYEFNFGHLDCLHIPMSEIPERAKELDNIKETYILCKSGNRASAVANFLRTNFGFSNIGAVTGGIEAYANKIDHSIKV